MIDHQGHESLCGCHSETCGSCGREVMRSLMEAHIESACELHAIRPIPDKAEHAAHEDIATTQPDATLDNENNARDPSTRDVDDVIDENDALTMSSDEDAESGKVVQVPPSPEPHLLVDFTGNTENTVEESNAFRTTNDATAEKGNRSLPVPQSTPKATAPKTPNYNRGTVVSDRETTLGREREDDSDTAALLDALARRRASAQATSTTVSHSAQAKKRLSAAAQSAGYGDKRCHVCGESVSNLLMNEHARICTKIRKAGKQQRPFSRGDPLPPVGDSSRSKSRARDSDPKNFESLFGPLGPKHAPATPDASASPLHSRNSGQQTRPPKARQPPRPTGQPPSRTSTTPDGLTDTILVVGSRHNAR